MYHQTILIWTSTNFSKCVLIPAVSTCSKHQRIIRITNKSDILLNKELSPGWWFCSEICIIKPPLNGKLHFYFKCKIKMQIKL